jgi:ankyrin repeat protein
MGSYFSHDHTESCCPTSGKWCKQMDDRTGSSLHFAIYNRYPESMCLNGLSKTKNIHGLDKDGYTLIHAVSWISYLQLIQALIDRGVNINAVTDDGTTALHIAAEYKSSQAKLLIDNGADVNAINSRGHTPLYYATWGKTGRVVFSC